MNELYPQESVDAAARLHAHRQGELVFDEYLTSDQLIGVLRSAVKSPDYALTFHPTKPNVHVTGTIVEINREREPDFPLQVGDTITMDARPGPYLSGYEEGWFSSSRHAIYRFTGMLTVPSNYPIYGTLSIERSKERYMPTQMGHMPHPYTQVTEEHVTNVPALLNILLTMEGSEDFQLHQVTKHDTLIASGTALKNFMSIQYGDEISVRVEADPSQLESEDD